MLFRTFSTTFTACLFLGMLFGVVGCQTAPKPLPILGERDTRPNPNSPNGVDTIYHTVPAFSFVDQDSTVITEATVKGKVYLVDFFFTSCPTICPRVKKNMIRVYEKFKAEPRFAILSHSIDTRHDSVAVLREYAKKLGADAHVWHFLTGNHDKIYDMAKEYLVAAAEDPYSAGGYTHSGNIMLIDSHRQIRGYYDGTKTEAVDKLLEDLPRVLKEGN